MCFRRESRAFKVVQVADMHYADGRSTGCEDVLLSQAEGRSDLDTTAFLYRVLRAEDPDLVVFTGDNIYGADATDAAKSMDAAVAPPIDMKLPWAAVLRNHDQEGTLSPEGVMRHLVGTTNSHSSFNPEGVEIDGYNYNFAVYGVEGSPLSEKSVLNLYFLDSGDYSTVSSVHGYGWIKRSQQDWFQKICSKSSEKIYESLPGAERTSTWHCVLPHAAAGVQQLHGNQCHRSEAGGNQLEINSGFFSTMVEAGDVKAAFVGHDHVNDFREA